MDVREKLIEILRKPIFPHELVDPTEAVADYLLDNGVTVQEWISVEERLPDRTMPPHDVLVYHDLNCGMFIDRAWYSHEKNKWSSAVGMNLKVTHWMPLPEPPKGRVILTNCIQACPYNTLDGCKVKEYNAICPITNMATPFTEYRMTNADRIRSMSDEELAEEISRISILDLCDIVFGGYCKEVATLNKTSQQRCAENVLEWLQQPVVGLRAGQPADCLEKSIAELKQEDQGMKELQIIIKRPCDGNQLNQQEGAESIPNGTMTVGWKFEAENGKLYGDYVILGQNTSDDVILEAIRLQLNQARETERAIIRTDSTMTR